jgi:hypothetical protein
MRLTARTFVYLLINLARKLRPPRASLGSLGLLHDIDASCSVYDDIDS